MPSRLTHCVGLVLALAVAGFTATSCSNTARTTTTPTDPSGTSATANSAAPRGEDVGAFVFRTQCAACHGAHGEGNLGPPLGGIAARMTEPAQLALVTNGLGRMPSFGHALSKEEIAAVVAYTRRRFR